MPPSASSSRANSARSRRSRGCSPRSSRSARTGRVLMRKRQNEWPIRHRRGVILVLKRQRAGGGRVGVLQGSSRRLYRPRALRLTADLSGSKRRRSVLQPFLPHTAGVGDGMTRCRGRHRSCWDHGLFGGTRSATGWVLGSGDRLADTEADTADDLGETLRPV